MLSTTRYPKLEHHYNKCANGTASDPETFSHDNSGNYLHLSLTMVVSLYTSMHFPRHSAKSEPCEFLHVIPNVVFPSLEITIVYIKNI